MIKINSMIPRIISITRNTYIKSRGIAAIISEIYA